MAGLFSRLKVWLKNENLKASDLNAEFNNIISNIDPTKMSGYSTNVVQMQIQTNPGSQGSESLATTEAGEIERLRYVISRIIGQSFWYDTPALSIQTINTLITQGNFTPPQNRIASGKTRASSNQPAFLVAGGSNAKVTLKGASTPFVYFIAGTQYTVSSDVDLTFSSFAPGASNTATVNDATLSGQVSSSIQGEAGSIMTMTAAGTNISSLQGTFGAFKIVDGGNTEYFIGYVNSSTQMTKCFRGYFFDSTSAPVLRTTINNSDTITVLKLFWVFVTTSGILDSTANNPTVSFATPTSPATGDYWFDLGGNLWKKFNGSSFVASNATLIGLAICDTTHCIATRSFEFYGPYDALNTIDIEIQDNNTLRTKQRGMRANVAGNLINFDRSMAIWSKPTNLDSGVADGNNKTFYVYLKDTGDVVLSDVIPYDRSQDLRGRYHPYNPWRALASVLNDSSSHFSSIISEDNYGKLIAIPKTATSAGAQTDAIIPCDATSAAFTLTLPPAVALSGKMVWIQKTDASLNVVTIAGNSPEKINGASTIKLSTQYEIVCLYSDGSNWFLISREYSLATQDGSALFTYENIGTVSGADIRYQRVGDRMYVQGKVVTGTVAGSAVAIVLPTGITINTSKISSSSNVQTVGFLNRLVSAASDTPSNTQGPFPLFFDGSTNNKLFIAKESGTTTYQYTKSTGTSLFSSSDVFTVQFNLPITGWE